MALFLSTFINKLDKKGRVSVPAPFRASLAGLPFQGIVAYPSLIKNHDAIEACGIDRMALLSDSIARLNPFSEDHDAFASILADSVQLPFDGDGRVMLPAALVAHAGLDDQIAFVGRGPTFQMWHPARFEVYHRGNRARARAQAGDLTLLPPRGEGGGRP